MRRLNNVNIFHKGVRHLGAIFLAISLFVGGVVFGNLNPAMPAYADVYMSAEDSVWQTSGNETCYINYTSKYYIEVSADNGRLMAYVSLKAGDILTSQVLAGGSARTSSLEEVDKYGNGTGVWHQLTGGNAYLIKLNGSALIGAGGKGGWSARAMTYTYAGRYDFSVGGTVPSGVNNAKFSSGAGGSFASWNERQGFQWTNGGNGNTIAGCTPAQTYPNELRGADAGSNYLDTSKCTLVGTPNNGTGVSVTLRPVVVTEKQSLSGIDDGISRIVQNLAAIKTSIDNLQENQSTEAPVFTVVAGKDFRFATNKYDDMLSGSSGGVTVTNNTVGDGAILVSGKLNTSGNYTIQINGKTFIFNVITEPSSSNVTVLLE